jgi:hypothetical protein
MLFVTVNRYFPKFPRVILNIVRFVCNFADDICKSSLLSKGIHSLKVSLYHLNPLDPGVGYAIEENVSVAKAPIALVTFDLVYRTGLGEPRE